MDPENITLLLKNAATEEDPEDSFQKIFPLVYHQLLQIAKNIRFQWQGDLTMNPTSLVHEAYLKLVDQDLMNIESRRHFFAIAAKAMKQILINYAEVKTAQKRGNNPIQVELHDSELPIDMTEEFSDQILKLCNALEELKKHNKRQSQVVHYRFFTGLPLNEIAELLEVSTRTIKRDWNSVKLWLYQQMSH